jgi:diguanylate cyclase (GGDEF)-like protein
MLPFDGFDELIRAPLEKVDPASLKRIKHILLEETSSRDRPFAFLIQKLAGQSLDDREARRQWTAVLRNKRDMEARLGRRVSVQTAAVDYFTSEKTGDASQLAPVDSRVPVGREEWIDRIYAPTYYLERLKDEMTRARRYNHSLSAIMLDVDAFHKVNEDLSYEVGDKILTLIVKIVKKSIRTVDIISRYAGDVFLIILPNTNAREAADLAERIRENIPKRTKRTEHLQEGVTVTLSVGQCDRDESSLDFARRMESQLQSGKKQQRNAVYVL